MVFQKFKSHIGPLQFFKEVKEMLHILRAVIHTPDQRCTDIQPWMLPGRFFRFSYTREKGTPVYCRCFSSSVLTVHDQLVHIGEQLFQPCVRPVGLDRRMDPGLLKPL